MPPGFELTAAGRRLHIVAVAQTAAPEVRGTYRRSPLAAILVFGPALFAGLALACLNAPSAGAESATLQAWTRPAPPRFTLPDLDQQSVSLRPDGKSIVLVHFFATWCEPCREEIPALRRLSEKTDPARLRVLAISVADVDIRVRRFVERIPVNFPVLLDRDRSVARAWSVSSLPATFILDSNLQPRAFIAREYDWDSFDLDAFLTSGPAATATAETINTSINATGDSP